MAVLSKKNSTALLLLLKAGSKSVVANIVEAAYRYRNRPERDPLPPSQSLSIAASLEDASDDDVSAMIIALRKVIVSCVYDGSSASTHLPADFHTDLKALIEVCISRRVAEWRRACIVSQPSLPRFVDVDWRIDVKVASDTISQMNVPTMMMRLEVEEAPSNINFMAPVRSVDVELSRESLQAMVDGLGKIRDQLGQVAGR